MSAAPDPQTAHCGSRGAAPDTGCGGPHGPLRLSPFSAMARIVGPYLAFGVLYILFSDMLLLKVSPDGAFYAQVSTLKGWAFVAISSVLFGGLLLRRERARAHSARLLQGLVDAVQDLARAATPAAVSASAAASVRKTLRCEGAALLLAEDLGAGPENAPDTASPLPALAIAAARQALASGSCQWGSRKRRRILAAACLAPGSPPPAVLCAWWAAPHSPTDEETRFLNTLAATAVITRERAATLEGLERLVAERTSELSAALEKARAADKVKSRFLANMSHELRTPLNSILGFAAILLKEMPGPLNAEQRKQMEMLRASASHLLDLINDLLDLSRIEAGELRLERARFDLIALCEEAVETVRNEAARKGLSLEFDTGGAPRPLEIESDRRRLKQILLNLLSNAVKFTRAGFVRLSVRPEGAAAVRLTVSDSGAGISPEEQLHVGMPFHQTASGRAADRAGAGGTGLGLAISKSLAALLGAKFGFTSEPGRGSDFFVTLGTPCEPAP